MQSPVTPVHLNRSKVRQFRQTKRRLVTLFILYMQLQCSNIDLLNNSHLLTEGLSRAESLLWAASSLWASGLL